MQLRSSHVSEDVAEYAALNVGQSALDPIVIGRQALVIESEQGQDGGVEIVDGRDVLDAGRAKLVGGAVAVRFLDAGAGLPVGLPSRNHESGLVGAASESRSLFVPD